MSVASVAVADETGRRLAPSRAATKSPGGYPVPISTAWTTNANGNLLTNPTAWYSPMRRSCLNPASNQDINVDRMNGQSGGRYFMALTFAKSPDIAIRVGAPSQAWGIVAMSLSDYGILGSPAGSAFSVESLGYDSSKWGFRPSRACSACDVAALSRP